MITFIILAGIAVLAFFTWLLWGSFGKDHREYARIDAEISGDKARWDKDDADHFAWLQELKGNR